MFPYLLKSLPAPAAEDDFPEAVLRFASSLNSSGVVASTAEELRDELLGVYNLTQFGGDYVRAWVQMGADAFVVRTLPPTAQHPPTTQPGLEFASAFEMRARMDSESLAWYTARFWRSTSWTELT